jgi:hypothetical protein
MKKDPILDDSPKTPNLPDNDNNFKIVIEENKFHALSDKKVQITKKVIKDDSSV